MPPFFCIGRISSVAASPFHSDERGLSHFGKALGMPSPYAKDDVTPQRQRVHHHPVPLIRKEEGGLRGAKLSYALAVHLLYLRLDEAA